MACTPGCSGGGTAMSTYVTEADGVEHVEHGVPFLVEGWDFQGCTSSDPELCTCGDEGAWCRTCGQGVKDGQHAIVITTWWENDDPDNDSCQSELHHWDCWRERGA